MPFPAAHSWTQALKWTVYTLLVVNLAGYFFEEVEWARHTLPEAPGLWDYLRNFPTTLDQGGWMMLVLVFELETYALPDRLFTRQVVRALLALRIPSYVLVVYAAFGYVGDTWELYQLAPYPADTPLCSLVDGDLSFQVGLDYEVLSAENCAALGAGGALFRVHDLDVVSDTANLAEARRQNWIAVVNAFAWFAVLIGLEVAVWLQSREIFAGPALRTANALQAAGYAVLAVCLLLWLWDGYLFYAWDAFLWLGGFAAIEGNMAEWRQEAKAPAAARPR